MKTSRTDCTVMCRFEGGPLDGADLPIQRGVTTVNVPVINFGEPFGMVQYTVHWHDDGPVAS